MKTRPTHPLLLCAFFFAALCANASATALDSSFGVSGRVAVELGDKGSRANAVLVQPDGKIVAAGYSSGETKRDFMLFRLLPDGSLDTAFNQNGTVTTAVSPSDDEALTLALQEDGKIIAAGYSSNQQNRDFALVRYNSDGSLDSSFGAAGMVVTAVGSSNDEITGVAVQEDGKIVLTGAAQGANGRVAVLARYLSDGKPDPAFGEAGFTLSVVGVDAQAESVALGKDGRILLSGTYSDNQRRGLMLLGFDSKGKLDQTFGEKGIAVPADDSVFSEGYGLFVNEDGSILVAGSTGSDGERDASLFRFAANGQPDSGFEQNGVLVSSAGQGDDVLYGVDVTESSIVAAGFKTVDEQREFLLVTYTQKADGKLSANLLTTGFSSGKDTATALAAVDNSVVAAGESTDDAEPKAAVSKYTLEEAAKYLVGGTAVETKTTASSDPGSQYVLTLQPYEVTRTTAIVPVEVQSALGDVSKRGVVFSTMSNPMLKDSSSSSSSDAPVVTNNSPTSVTGTSATLMLTTDVDATCKYTTSKEGMDYSLMKELFDTTGGKTHSEPVSGLTEGTHTYYARCKNTANSKVNTTDTVISFTVTASTDSGPVRSNLKPSGSISETSATLSLTTDVAATCKYDTTAGTAFDDMESTFSTTGAKAHSQVVNDLEVGKTYSYYVRCKNTATSKANTVDTVISFTVTTSTGTEPTVDNATADAFNTAADVILKVTTTSETATCKYSKSDVSYDKMTQFTNTNSTSHSVNLGSAMTADEYTYYVRCMDQGGNKNSTSEEISFLVTPVVITKKTAASFASTATIELKVATDVDATCKYDITDGDYTAMVDTFDTTGGKTHSADLGALLGGVTYTYYVRCEDASGDSSPVGTEITFAVTAALSPRSDLLLVSSEQLINNALRNVGRFFIGTAMAESGCCSSHGGVCGNQCCDGSALSEACSGTGSSTASSTATTGSTSTSSTGSSSASSTSTSSTSKTTTSSNVTASATTANGDFIEAGYTTEGSGSGTFNSKLTKLKPGTFFYARAYAVVSGTVYYGNEVGFRTADSCFVATAAFGSVFHPAVQVLRDFRDQFLSSSSAGRALVDLYYRTSPPLADLVSQHDSLRMTVRLLLLPVTGAAWLALHLGTAALLLPLGAVILLLSWQMLRRRTQGRAAAIL